MKNGEKRKSKIKSRRLKHLRKRDEILKCIRQFFLRQFYVEFFFSFCVPIMMWNVSFQIEFCFRSGNVYLIGNKWTLRVLKIWPENTLVYMHIFISLDTRKIYVWHVLQALKRTKTLIKIHNSLLLSQITTTNCLI